MKVRLARWISAWLGLVALVACASPTSTPIGETLRPGGAVASDAGVSLGAPASALSRPVGLRIEASTGEPEVALAASVQGHGPWHRLSAERDVEAPDGSGFVVGLPVPPEADPSRLAVAVFVPAEDNIYDGSDVDPGTEVDPDEDHAATDDVAYLRGRYDAERDAFLVAFYALPADGETFRLVEGPSFAPAGTHPQELEASTHQRFVTYCHPEFDDDVSETCRFEDLQDAIAALDDAYLDYTGLGFAEPKMYREPQVVGYDDQGVPIYEPGPWVMTIRACSQTGSTKGKFTGSANATSAWSCIGSGGVTAGAIRTIRHEFFHATQWGYAPVRASFQYWVLESTATMAERSLATLARDTGRPVRDVDVRLNGGSQKYATQDFWLYLGLRHGLGLDMLIPLFEEGASTSAVQQMIAQELTDHQGIGDAFWAWAKNQAFEKDVPLGGAGFATLCGLDTDASGAFYALDNSTGGPLPIDYAREAPPGDTVVAIEPLTARVVKIAFDSWAGGAYQQGVEVLGHADLRIKFFDAADIGSDRCIDRYESRTHAMSVGANTRTTYALIANTGLDSARTATVRFPGTGDGPDVDILAPAEQSVHTEGDVAFRAAASGFGGTDPSVLLVRWSHVVDGVPTVLATSASGEFVDIQLCDGAYQITATVEDPLTSETASDTVSITVARSDDPPAACAPDIRIVRPLPSNQATYVEGDAIPLEAVVDEDPPEYLVTWHVGSVDGRIIGTGLTGTAKLAAGLHTVWAVYGPASHGIYVRVVDGTDDLPTATITEPPGDLTISYLDEPSCDVTVPLEGTGHDPEDGALTGTSLQWRYRDPALTTSWSRLGSGTTQSLSIRCGQTLEVQLRAIDSGGQRDSDEIVITFSGPTG